MSHRSGEMWVIRLVGEIDGRGNTDVWDVLEKCAEGTYGRKGKPLGGSWVNLIKSKVEEGLVMK